MTTFQKEAPRHFVAGCYLCPQAKKEVPLETLVPGPWVEWPVRVKCSACGKEHVLEYKDVIHREPAFGYE